MFDLETQQHKREQDVTNVLNKIKGPFAMEEKDIPLCANVLVRFDYIRARMRAAAFDDTDTLVFVAEYDTEKGRHQKRKPRHNGDPYFEGHLVPVTILGAEEQSLVEIADGIILIKHDTIEDIRKIEEIKPASLLKTDRYTHLIPPGRMAQIKRLQRDSWEGVTSLTKIKRQTDEETERETFRNSLIVLGDTGDIKTLMRKNADRRHNMSTIDGHPEKEKRERIARETAKIHLPWSSILETRAVEEGLILDTMRILIPDAYQGYMGLMARKKREFLAPHQEKILDQLREGEKYLPCIQDITFVQTGVRRIFRHIESANTEIHLDERDPGFVTTIITAEKEDIAKIREAIIDRFADSRTQVEIKPLNNRGTFVRVFNRKFGGIMMFRINDMVSETFSKQGILASASKAELTDLRNTSGKIASKSFNSTTDIFDMANDELLKRNMTVYTTDNDPIKLKRGSTVLDFARRIDPEILIGAQKCYISDDIWGRNKKEISLFEELAPGCYVFVESCLSEKGEKKKEPEKINIGPEWLLFADEKTKEAISAYLKKPPSKLQEERGGDWLRRFCKMFKVDEEAFEKSLLEKEKIEKEELYKKIGKGEIELTENLKIGSNRWLVTVVLDDKPGEKKKFMDNIFSKKINIDTDETTKGDNGKSTLRFEISFLSINILTTDFIKGVIKTAQDGYEISAHPFK